MTAAAGSGNPSGIGLRTPLVAGNWKMNKTVPESLELVQAVVAGLPAALGSRHRVPDPATPPPADAGRDPVEVAVLPPFTSLWPVAAALDRSGIGLGAQDIYWETAGAYTGEVSPAMLAGWCRYALVGHSERRRLFGETDATVNRKARAALAHGLRPIIAVGETLEEREGGQTETVLSHQVPEGLAGLDEEEGLRMVLAYEPVWAIGTGRQASPEQAEDACALIRRLTAEALGTRVAEAVRILYGGSMTPANAAELLALPNVDGGLIGGASLKAEDFLAIVAAAVPG
jgi:triosephosphate isomerase